MTNRTGEWTWSQLNRPDSDFLSVMLLKKNHSIVLVLPRPAGWQGEQPADQELIRGILSEAAEEAWSLSQKAG